MVNTTKTIGISLIAALTLAFAVSHASANRLASSTERFTATWNSLVFTARTLLGEIEVRCRVTLSGNFHSRTITKFVGSLIGGITDARVGHPCTGGEGFALNGVERTPNTLPWHLTYEGFEGTLPNITGIRVLLARFAFLIRISAAECRYGTERDNISGRITREAGGNLTSIAPIAGLNTAVLHTRLGGFADCPTTGTLTGTGTVGAGVRITLI